MGNVSFRIFLLCALGMARATTATPLPLAQCLKEASAANLELLAQKQAVEKAKANVGGAWSGFLPSINGSGNYTHGNSISNSNGFANPSLSNTGSTFEQYSIGISATQNVFSGFQDLGKLRQARANLEGAEASLRTTSAQVLYDLTIAYVQVMIGQAQIELLRHLEERRSDNLSLVELRFEGGRENKGSVLRSSAARAQAEAELHQAERNVSVSKKMLLRRMGRTFLDDDISVQTLPTTGSPPAHDTDLKALALKVPALELASANTRATEAAIDRSRSGFLPSLNATASMFRQGSDFPPTGDKWSLGLSLTVPIFSGLSTFHDVSAAQADWRQAERNRDAQAQDALLRLEQASANFRSAYELERAQELSLKAAETRAEIARHKYTTGLQTFDEWDIIENDLITQQKQMLVSRQNAWNAEAGWKQALGEGVL